MHEIRHRQARLREEGRHQPRRPQRFSKILNLSLFVLALAIILMSFSSALKTLNLM